jgi:4-diphosphocytidyl-2-C-methyl-D-erythritol kinase
VAAKPSAAIRQFAPAKLNLYLHVVGRRPDGYHALDSLAVFLGVGDEVAARPADELALTVTGPFAAALPSGPENLVLRAARALAQAAGVPARAALTLTKNLPVAAGLGGGSADAAAALAALERLWRTGMTDAALDRLALGLGADVPLCRRRRPQQVAGIGEVLSDAPALPPFHVVLANPGTPLSTAAVFAALAPAFSQAAPLQRPPADARDLAALLAARRNDLEPPARRLVPALDDALAALAASADCLLARMSGSGATCFGIFATRPAAEAAAKAVANQYPAWWVAAAACL